MPLEIIGRPQQSRRCGSCEMSDGGSDFNPYRNPRVNRTPAPKRNLAAASPTAGSKLSMKVSGNKAAVGDKVSIRARIVGSGEINSGECICRHCSALTLGGGLRADSSIHWNTQYLSLETLGGRRLRSMPKSFSFSQRPNLVRTSQFTTREFCRKPCP